MLATMARHGLDARVLAQGVELIDAFGTPRDARLASDAAIVAHKKAEKARAEAFRIAADELWTWYVRWSLAVRAPRGLSGRA